LILQQQFTPRPPLNKYSTDIWPPNVYQFTSIDKLIPDQTGKDVCHPHAHVPARLTL